MQGLAHITAESAELYRRRLLPPAELLAAQAHAARCEECRARLAAAAGLDAAFTKLREEFSVSPVEDEETEHLPYEQLASFVDGSLDEVTREMAESHLAVCAECAGDAEDLRQYQTVAAPAVLDAPAAPNTSGGDSRAKAPGVWRRLLSTFNVGGTHGMLVPTAAAAAVIVAALFGLWVVSRRDASPDADRLARTTPEAGPKTARSETQAPESNPSASPTVSPTPELPAREAGRQGELAALPTPTKPTRANRQSDGRMTSPAAGVSQVALDDGGGRVVFDARGGLRGLEALSPEARSAIRRSLETRRVDTPRVLDGLAGAESGVLMSGATNAGGQDGVPFALVGPVSRVVREDRPTLRWRPLAGAVGYRASVVSSDFQVVAESGPTDANEWTPTAPLARGRTYYWQVTATLADGEEVISPRTPAPRARFRVLEQGAAEELRRLEEAAPESHLARGVLYARAGLVAEAESEFRRLVALNPHSPAARNLLRSVSTARRRP